MLGYSVKMCLVRTFYMQQTGNFRQDLGNKALSELNLV